MDSARNPQPSAMSAWRPRSLAQWALALVAAALAATTLALAIYMLRPVDFDSAIGQSALAALLFPLHLLVLTAIVGALVLVARRLRGRLAASLFGLTAILSALLALWPALAMWQFARQQGVPLSLHDYIANATRLNFASPPIERSVEYGTAADGTRLMLDVWRADSAVAGKLRPAVVRIHGGAWMRGQRSQFPEWNRWLNRRGYDVFDVDYRKAPPARWKEEVGDVKCALGWVVANAGRLGIDPARITTKGFSAGGNLAMLAAYSAGDPRLPPSCDAPAVTVHNVINIYGPVDLIRGYDSGGSIDYSRNALRTYIGGTPTEYPERYRAVSPISHVGAKTPPTITLIGGSDRIVSVDQPGILARALAQAGVPYESYILPANDHGFDANWGGFGTQFARAKIDAFLRRHR
jgi:acetyl esterase/lipase